MEPKQTPSKMVKRHGGEIASYNPGVRRAGESQAGVVMREFHKGKLRSSSGQKVTKPAQAKAIAMSEERTATKRGRKRRTWRGSTRMRPK